MSPEYTAWQRMKDRCLNEASKDYRYYGGRGITVCDRWLGERGFLNFLSDMGRRPTQQHTLDRKNNDLGYSKRNCRWATRAEQSRNRRPFKVDGTKHRMAKVIVIGGIRATIAGWARIMGVDRCLIRARLKRGWDPVKAVKLPAWSTKKRPNQKRFAA